MIQIDDSKYIVDTIDNIIWDRKNICSNWLILFNLRQGLVDIAHRVRSFEIDMLTETREDHKYKIIEHLHSDFNWFANSLLTYMKLIALVSIVNDENWQEGDLKKKRNIKEYKRRCKEYIETNIPEILAWRNKVGAHLSLTDPLEKDDLSTLLGSVAEVKYFKPLFYANGVSITSTLTSKIDTEIPAWSVTTVYDKLTSRLFPNNPLPKIDKKIIPPSKEDLISIAQRSINLQPSGIVLDSKNDIVWNNDFIIPDVGIILNHLKRGLAELTHYVRSKEHEKVNANGEMPTLSCLELNTEYINCSFIWFSTSLICFLKLIAFVDIVQKKGWSIEDLRSQEVREEYSEYCNTYVESLVPQVNLWRNKVGAHFALTDPRKDNLTTMRNSITEVSFSKPFYYTNVISWGVSDGSRKEDINIPEWSLTEEYEKLTERFFQDFKLETIYEKQLENYELPPKEDLTTLIMFLKLANRKKNQDIPLFINEFNTGLSILKKNEKLEDAIPHFKKAIEMNKLDVAGWNGLVCTYFKLDLIHSAELVIRKILSMNIQNYLTHFYYGQIFYYKLRKPDKALEYFKKIKKGEEHYEDAQKEIQHLSKITASVSI